MMYIQKEKIAFLCLFLLCFQLEIIPVRAQTSDTRIIPGTKTVNPQDPSGLSFRKEGTGLQGTKVRQRSLPSSLSVGLYQVHVLGEVEFPGTYRVSPSDRIFEGLQQAGGISQRGSKRKIELRRGEKTQVLDFLKFQLSGLLEHNPFLQDNDIVFVPLKSSVVQVVGAVKRPEEYEVISEKTLLDVIQLAGGFSVGAARQSPIRIIRFEVDKKNVLEVSANDAAMKDFPIRGGDVVAVPNVITQKNQFDYDVPVLPGDNIFYPSYEDRVFILGGVTLPGAYPFNPYYNLSQYLSLAGGTTKLATGKVDLLTPEGKRKKLSKQEKNIVIINPGDTILVDERRIPPEGWINLILGVAGFGLSATATVLTLSQ